MSSVFLNFSCLDELIQIVYQSVHRFVLLSSVTEDEWVLHLGLSGPEGRWWRGSWKAADVSAIVGSKLSDKLLETFAGKLADSIIKGETFIGDWSTEPNAPIKLIFAPSSKRPMHVRLTELSAADAAAHATKIFLDIALQAQSRKNHLHGSSYQIPSTIPSSPARSKNGVSGKVPPDSQPSRAKNSKAGVEFEDATSSKKRKESETPEAESKSKAKVVPKPLKGASLANPNKKARKYKAVEFESDEE